MSEVDPDPYEPAGEQAAGTTGREPEVSALGATRLEISELHVRSVRPTGGECFGAR